MSRIGKQPISIPGGVTVAMESKQQIKVTGPKGALAMVLRPEVEVDVQANKVHVKRTTVGGERQGRAYHGMTRALIANMVRGVANGYERKLEIQGVGWNAQAQPKKLVLNIGFCHPIEIPIPEDLKVECPNPTTIVIRGPSKQSVGQLAANVRKVRPPEPYKGKGIRYEGEYVRRKAGKSFGS